MRSEGTATDPVLDLDAALARLGGDRELFADLVGYLLEDAPPLIGDLTVAVNARDAPLVRSKAHALKNLVAGCGGVRATNITQALEDSGQSGNLGSAPTLLTELQRALAELTNALAEHRR